MSSADPTSVDRPIITTAELDMPAAGRVIEPICRGLALQTAKRDMVEPLKDAGKGVSGGFERGVLVRTHGDPEALLVVFASVGLVLVAIGVYSVIAYTVSRQTHEIGIRMALGASRSSVLQMVALMGLKLVGIGGAIGFLASLAATKVLAAQLTNVSRFDPSRWCASSR